MRTTDLVARLCNCSSHGCQNPAKSQSPRLSRYQINTYTYRDLMLNVGYRLAAEHRFQGSKNGQKIEALVSCYTKT